MSSADADNGRSLETMLFESLVHHLIEKGVLTKNDALSVVQTVAQVKRGQLSDGDAAELQANPELALLKRMFDSFEAMRERPRVSRVDGHNVHSLRPPLHDDDLHFPAGD